MRKFLAVLIGILLIAGIIVYSKFYTSPKTQNSTVASLSPSPAVSTSTLANPASENCVSMGGKVVIQKRGDGGEFGLCEFQDGRACEEWALFKKTCPSGGIKTTGFDTIAQKYCAWLGGQTTATQNALCKFANGTVCDDQDLFNGLCMENGTGRVNGTNPHITTMLGSIKKWAPNVKWGNEQTSTQEIMGKSYQGESITGTVTSNLGSISDLGEQSPLLKSGWTINNNLAAGGPTGGVWAYTKGKELLYFTFRNNSFTPPPGETKCPCILQIAVFHTDSYNP